MLLLCVQVESLFREYHNKMSSRIRTRKERQKLLKKAESTEASSADDTPAQSEIDAE